METVLCTGRDGVVREFEYWHGFDELDKVWHFFVATIPRQPPFQTFDFTFTPLGDSAVRQTSIDHHEDPAYAAMGIPEALLPVVKAFFGKEVESSPPDGVEPGVFRSMRVEKTWKRLVAKGLAEYLPDRRIYRVK